MESICIITLEEQTIYHDITSTLEVTIDSRLPPSLDSIIDRNIQLLFDQDPDNPQIYRAMLVDKVTMVGILSGIRNSGWEWGTSNGHSDDGKIIRNFYFEKKIDMSKIKLISQPPKRSTRKKVLHFGAPTRTPSPGTNDSNGSANGQPLPPPAAAEEFIMTSPASRRASISEGKTTSVFKQLAERRKLSQSSHHPLDISRLSIDEGEEEPSDHAISSASKFILLLLVLHEMSYSLSFFGALGSPHRKSGDVSDKLNADKPKPPPPKPPGKVGGLASMFESQLHLQGGPGNLQKRRSSLAVGFKPNTMAGFPSSSSSPVTSNKPPEPTSLAGLTSSRPTTERKRRPTPTQKHSIHISEMKRPLVKSASFEEAQANTPPPSSASIPEENESDLLKKLVEDEVKNISRQQDQTGPTLKTLSRSNSPVPTRRKSVSKNPL